MVRKSVYDRLTDLLIDLVTFPSDDLSLERTWIRGLNYTISTKRTIQASIFEIYPLHSHTCHQEFNYGLAEHLGIS